MIGAFNGAYNIGEAGYHSDTVALVNKMTIRPSDQRIRAIDRLIKTLCTNLSLGTLSRTIDYLYCFAAHDQQAANLNWANPGNFTIVNNGAAWTIDQGYIGDGTSYLETNWNAATNGVNFVQNSAMQGIYQLTDIDSGVTPRFSMGATGLSGAAGRQINQKLATGVNNLRTNSLASTNVTSARKGLFVWSRTASNLTSFYYNGNLITTSATASTGVASFTDNILGCDVNGLPSTTITDLGNTFAFVIACAGYGSLERQRIFYRAMNEYLRTIGSINNF